MPLPRDGSRQSRLLSLSRTARRDSLRFGHHAKNVPTRKPREVAVAPATLNELGDEVRVARHVRQSERQVRGTVVVTANADVLDAGYARYVVHVIRDVRHGRQRHIDRAIDLVTDLAL